MKTIGLLGGMSWESTETYYRAINEAIRGKRGGLHSAKIVLYSVDFHEIEQLQQAGKWDEAGNALGHAARSLQGAGAEFIVLCTNTMHRVADEIERHISIPLLHIADATAQEIKGMGITRVGLLGTRYTMEQDFYRGRMARHGLEVITPDEKDRETVHRVIYDELCLGLIRKESRDHYKRIIEGLAHRKIDGVILGCTEISLLVKPEDSPVPLFDTTRIHARQAAAWSLQEGHLTEPRLSQATE